MIFAACGLNHKTAPLALREQLAITPASHAELLTALTAHESINEAMLLSTCNRTEFYCLTSEPSQLLPWLADYHRIDEALLHQHFYTHTEYEGIRHMLRVASGLDSMMLGEPQILGQMKNAYRSALDAGTIGKQLRPICEYAFGATKRIRNSSGIGINPVSVAYAGINLINKVYQNLSKLNVFIIGSGDTSSLVAKYLIESGVKDIVIASRTQQHANELAQKVHGRGITIGDIPEHLPNADIIISATACPLPFINKSLVERALLKRHNKSMFFLDLAVPRDIEQDVGELANVFLYNIDDLQSMVDEGLNERRMAAKQAELLIESELDGYIKNHRTLRATDVICSYREGVKTQAQKEVQRALNQMKQGKAYEEVLNEFSHRLINKLTHSPTVGLREAASEGREDLLDLARYLFREVSP